jgi:hypothetical protein
METTGLHAPITLASKNQRWDLLWNDPWSIWEQNSGPHHQSLDSCLNCNSKVINMYCFLSIKNNYTLMKWWFLEQDEPAEYVTLLNIFTILVLPFFQIFVSTFSWSNFQFSFSNFQFAFFLSSPYYPSTSFLQPSLKPVASCWCAISDAIDAHIYLVLVQNLSAFISK